MAEETASPVPSASEGISLRLLAVTNMVRACSDNVAVMRGSESSRSNLNLYFWDFITVYLLSEHKTQTIFWAFMSEFIDFVYSGAIFNLCT